MKRLQNKYFLVAIVVFAAVLRILNLDSLPPELFGDELDVGYHAYSIWRTGRDYSGNFLPFYIESFTEWRAPLLMYLTSPFVGIFGLNEWGVRLPSAVFGVITVYLIYLLAKKIFESEKIGFLGAFLLAVSPWHIQYSRGAFEASLLLMLVLCGTVSVIRGFENPGKRFLYWAVGVFVFSLTFYTYNTANVFIPLLALGFAFFWKKKILAMGFTRLAALITFAAVLSVPIVSNILFGSAALRYSKQSVFTDNNILDQVNRDRSLYSQSFVRVVAHNKPVYWSRKIIETYSSAFSTQFLFVEGDLILRHSVPGVGQFFWIEAVFLIVGLFSLSKSKLKYKWIIFWWLVIAPVPSALTKDGIGHATRLILMLPPMILVMSCGAMELYKLLVRRKTIFRKITVGMLLLVFLGEFLLYLHELWIHYPKDSWRWWHVGYKQAMQSIDSYSQNYEKVFINDTYEPAFIRFVFWTKQDPGKIASEFGGQAYQENIVPGFNGFKYGKYYFGSTSYSEKGEKLAIQDFVQKGDLYLVSQRDEVAGDWDWSKNPPSDIQVLDTVYDPYGEPIFYLVTKDEI